MFSYDQALKEFNSINKPPRAAYWQTAPDNAKPLKTTSERHKSIHMRGDGAIYYKLYDTPVATFYPVDPTTNTYTVVMRYYNSVTTNKFMSDFGLHYCMLRATDDKDSNAVKAVRVPYAPYGGYGVSAVLTFDAESGLLITDPAVSWHAPIGTRVASAERKAERKQLRQRLEHLITLAMFSVDRLLNEAQPSFYYAQPFTSPYSVRGRFDANIEPLATFYHKARRYNIIDEALADPEFNDLYVKALTPLMTTYISHRASKIYDSSDALNSEPESIASAITTFDTSDFGRYVMQHMIRVFRLDEGDTTKPYPLFQSSLPRKMVAVSRSISPLPPQFNKFV